MVKFTILTPTYNRAELLSRVYQSLIKQTYKDFEWIIVDDGSTDNTKKVVESLMEDSLIKIKYIYKLNGGKHTAVNEGLNHAEGKLLIVLDSDDELVENALEVFYSYWDKIFNENNKIVSVSGLDIYKDSGEIVGDKFEEDEFISDHIECKLKMNIQGDKAEVYRTDILKQFPFPEIKGEKFVTEDIVHNQIALSGYKTIYTNNPIKIIEYLEDGLTSRSYELSMKNPQGKMIIFNQYISMKQIGIKRRIRAGFSYCRFGFLANKSIVEQYKMVENKLIFLVSIPIGYIIYAKDKIKKKR